MRTLSVCIRPEATPNVSVNGIATNVVDEERSNIKDFTVFSVALDTSDVDQCLAISVPPIHDTEQRSIS